MAGKRILVIEDHEENRRLLRDLLTSVGYELIEAVTGEEGVGSLEIAIRCLEAPPTAIVSAQPKGPRRIAS